jgi:hypothetical protein
MKKIAKSKTILKSIKRRQVIRQNLLQKFGRQAIPYRESQFTTAEICFKKSHTEPILG